MKRIPAAVATLVLLATLAAPAAGVECPGGARAAATLLFPYFEVDLAGSSGSTTLIAIGNASSVEPALAHVVLWTDRGLPTLAFNLHLDPDDVQTISLRDIFLTGALPSTGAGPLEESFPGCTTPLALPPLGEAERQVLREKHTGQDVDATGLCWGTGAGGALALGFVTVDAARSCSSTIRYPADEGYFAEDDSGLASDANQLWGDWFLIDPSSDYAQGNEAVHLVADGSRFGNGLLPTFYEFAFDSRADHRAPLPVRHRARYLNGGAFDGGTDLILFAPPVGWAAYGPPDCGSYFGDGCHLVSYTPYDEDGNAGEVAGYYNSEHGGAVTSRRKVGDPPLPVDAPFGFLDLRSLEVIACQILSPGVEPLQAYLLPIHSAEGRFSVGLNAVATATFCEPEESPAAP